MLWWIAQNMLVSGLLAAAAALLCRVRRLSPAVKHALWLLVLVKLVTPPLACYRLPPSVERLIVAWPFEPSTGDEQPERSVAAELVDDAEFANAKDIMEHDVDDLPFVSFESAETADSASAESSRNRERDATTDTPRSRFVLVPSVDSRAATTPGEAAQRAGMLALTLWLLGAVPLATLQTIRLVRLLRLTRRSTPTPAWLDRLVREAAERLRVRPPALSVVPRACSPLVYALGRSRLIWPAALNEQLTRAEQEAVLLHELAHLRRRDHWIAWLELAAGWVWWFNPIYWYARQQLREYAELACDAWVVALLPSGRRTYAQALIEVTEFVSSAPAALPAVAMGNVARSSLERRLTMILRDRISYRVPLAGAVAIGLSLLAVLPGWSQGQAPGPKVGALAGAEVGSPAAEPASGERASSDSAPADQPAAGAEPSAGVVEAANEDAAPRRAARFFFAAGADVDQPAEGTPHAADERASGTAPVADTRQPGDTVGAEDQRIAALEAKLAELLAEVQSLRRTSSGARGMSALGPMRQGGLGGPMGAAAAMRGPMAAGGGLGGRPLKTAVRYTRVGKIGPNTDSPRSQLPADVETLTRARYKLPASTAAALTSFIHDHVKAHVEMVTEGETLTVTASHEDQLRIATFIELLREPSDESSRLPEKAHRGPADVPRAETSNTLRP